MTLRCLLVLALAVLSEQSLRSTFEWAEPPVLDIACDAFDDQYRGCTQEMEIHAKKLLSKEKAANAEFSQVWKKAEAEWSRQHSKLSLPAGFRTEYGIAVLVYTADSGLYKDFNTAVAQDGRDRRSYLRCFQYKAMHYYLTRALQVLRQDCTSTYRPEVYRGVSCLHLHPQGETVRFGRFTSTSLDKQEAMKFGTDTFFTIHTCYGVPISRLSFMPQEQEMLIPPYECFRVVNYARSGGSNEIVLHSQNSTFSRYNCEYVKVPAHSPPLALQSFSNTTDSSSEMNNWDFG
ncbi:ecto-ADP-ribosyltransferase 5-like [Apteryx mantelli]|uniref:NAD(P)(+)--arginine ADP-ribosyltransferase n=1 Tax=Apteryx mantelli TaxID=2696672 RepID=A0ABM4DZ14_9AVES